MKEINTLSELIRAVSQARFGGYYVDMDIKQEHSEGGWLIIHVYTGQSDMPVIRDYVGADLFGEFWFDDNDAIMQVL